MLFKTCNTEFIAAEGESIKIHVTDISVNYRVSAVEETDGQKNISRPNFPRISKDHRMTRILSNKYIYSYLSFRM